VVSKAEAHGFTLVELLVAQALGLAMMTVLVASLSSLYKSVQVSADAAENSETAYFLMDALEQWLSDSRSPMLTTDSLSLQIGIEGDVGSMVIDDPCGTPLQSPFDFYRAGVAVVPAGNVSCLPSSSVDESSVVLLIERRVPCGENCGDAGFYAALSDCSSGLTRPKWYSGEEGMIDEAGGKKDDGGTNLGDVDGGSNSEICDTKPQLFELHRILIYARNYSHKRVDGVPALMMSRLAAEPEPRWLRSDMLANGVFAWDLQEQMGAYSSRAVRVGFSVKGKHQSTSVDRTIPLELHSLELHPLELHPLEPRLADRRPEDRPALDLAWP
jgi:hypothetical protein